MYDDDDDDDGGGGGGGGKGGEGDSIWVAKIWNFAVCIAVC